MPNTHQTVANLFDVADEYWDALLALDTLSIRVNPEDTSVDSAWTLVRYSLVVLLSKTYGEEVAVRIIDTCYAENIAPSMYALGAGLFNERNV